jgi:hypothetical protein
MDDLKLRDAVPADAEAITRFHVRLWRDTYRAIAPDAAMALLDEARRLPAWQAALKAPPPQGAVIALAGAGIVGWSASAPPRTRCSPGEARSRTSMSIRPCAGAALARGCWRWRLAAFMRRAMRAPPSPW